MLDEARVCAFDVFDACDNRSSEHFVFLFDLSDRNATEQSDGGGKKQGLKRRARRSLFVRVDDNFTSVL